MPVKLFLLSALVMGSVVSSEARMPVAKNSSKPIAESRAATRLSYGQRVLRLVNNARQAQGLQPLRTNDRLSAAAQVLADDLASTGDFNHRDSRGRSVGNRVDAQGYRWRTAGENLAKGQLSPEQVVDGWLHSPKHRENILSSEFHDLGFGLAEAGGQLIWVQVFGTSF